ncbi:MAG: hypothetical protein HY371_15845 [Devosia nanyangense]|nr:hypothetical protein [Devosia nanyangense]
MLYRPATRPSLLRTVWDELQPYPGRLDLSVRMAVLCVLVVVVAMANKVPEAALSCYLIFFASKDNSGSGIIIGLGLIFAASVGIMLGAKWMFLTGIPVTVAFTVQLLREVYEDRRLVAGISALSGVLHGWRHHSVMAGLVSAAVWFTVQYLFIHVPLAAHKASHPHW